SRRLRRYEVHRHVHAETLRGGVGVEVADRGDGAAVVVPATDPRLAVRGIVARAHDELGEARRGRFPGRAGHCQSAATWSYQADTAGRARTSSKPWRPFIVAK